ncbi:MAG: hypothetical protein PVI80_03810 [Anaerolineae bacterium]|jgi:hypothetical protein
MERISYKGWPNCYRLSNGLVDLVVTADVGPRIIRLGFVGQDNEFKEFSDMLGQTGGDEWRIYGGYRLWHAPEAQPRTYYPDNEPVQVKEQDGFVRIVQSTEPTTGIEKQIDLWLSPDEAHVIVTGRLRNKNLWPVELAPWSLSVMAQGGVAILPLPPRGSHAENLQPTSSLTLWAYTDMSDRRWTWGSRYVLLRQEPDMETPQKVGALVPDGWLAYARNGHLFVKTFDHVPGASYPDLGCSAEIFTNADFLEAESLAPLVSLEPGAAVEHVEHWFLFRDVPMPENEADVEAHVLPQVGVAKALVTQTRDR